MAERNKAARSHAEDVSPKLLRPKMKVTHEEIRGIEDDAGEVEQTDEDEEATGDDVERKHPSKNRRKKENRQAATQEERKSDEAFEAAVAEHWEDMTAQRIQRDSNLSQEAAGDEEEEWRKPKTLTSPMRVTAEEKTLHELTHIPYKPWCKYCVLARARNMAQGGKIEETEGGVTRVSMDYHFMGKDDEKAHENPMLVIVNERTKEKFARLTG